MVDRRPLSKGEMEIARALWDIGPATVREIHEFVSANKTIDFSTVQTYLRRIESKGYANSKLKGRVRTYSSKTKPGTVIRETVDDLVDRLFGGEAMPLVRHSNLASGVTCCRGLGRRQNVLQTTAPFGSRVVVAGLNQMPGAAGFQQFDRSLQLAFERRKTNVIGDRGRRWAIANAVAGANFCCRAIPR